MFPPIKIPDDLKLDVNSALQCGFIIPIFLILLIDNVPILASRFLPYGARSDLSSIKQETSRPISKELQVENKTSQSLRFLDLLATIRVPHTWFNHFYIISLLCSIFWAYQSWGRGVAYQFLSRYISLTDGPYTQIDKLVILWSLMLIQGTRRLYESIVYIKPTKSTIWVGHYGMGMGFYIMYNMAIGVETIRTLRAYDSSGDNELLQCGPWERLFLLIQVCCALFCMYRQNILHYHLYTLPSSPNYQVPSKDEFTYTTCPHYGYEVSFYWLMASMATVLGRKMGEMTVLKLNFVFWLAYAFVFINLRTTAVGTREWYCRRFGDSVGVKALLTRSYYIN